MTARLRSTHLAAGVALAISSLLVSGCGGSGNTAADKPDRSSTSSASASNQASTGQPSGSASGATPNADLGDPVASRTTSADGYGLQLKVYPVHRTEDLATLNFTMTVTKAGGSGMFQVATLLADGDFDSSDTASGDTVDGVKMLDSANKKVYLVASDGSGHCLCTRDTSGVFLGMGETRTFSTTYAAPPPDVTSVSLVFPAFGTVTGVPVQ